MRKEIFLMLKKSAKFLSRFWIGRVYLIKIAYRFAYNNLFCYLKPKFIEVEGCKIYLNLQDQTISDRLVINNAYEQFETQIIKKEVKEGDVVLDIGANIGYYTVILSKLVGEKGKIIAFEPDPENFVLLKKNVKINNCENVTLVQKAVSDETRKLKLYLSEDNKGDHRIYDAGEGRKYIEIEAISLDDYFKNYSRKIGLIKMDIQGAEPVAIQGMTLLLEKNKDVKIITEFEPFLLKKFGVEPKEYLKLLMRHDFRLHFLNEQKRKIELVDIDKLLEIYTPEKENYTNLLCVRQKNT